MKRILLILVCFLFLSFSIVFADHYIAFSLRTAQSYLSTGNSENNVIFVGGITHPIAAIYDKDVNDIILVGKIENNHSPVSLDDWAVALKAVLIINRDPAVSIDRTSGTEQIDKQKVRFEGGLENTQFGKDLLAADVILKRLGLKTLSADIFNVSSYLDLSVEDFEKSGKQNPLVSRFWFLPDREHSKVTVQDGLIIVEEYRILVKNEIMSAVDGATRDLPAEIFAQNLYASFQDIKLYYPELSRMEQLYYVAALAQGLEASGMASSSALSYWLNDFHIKENSTPQDYPIEKNSATAIFQDKEMSIVVSGGIDLDVMVYRLQSGGIEAIKNYVIKSRPNDNSLSWEVPLLTSVWDTNYDPMKLEEIKTSERKKANLSTSIMREFVPGTSTNTSLSTYNFKISEKPLSTRSKSITYNNHLSHVNNNFSPVGGVMLQGAATMVGNSEAEVDLSSGSFSFVVDGENARMDPNVFRQFVTTLWAVYYSKVPPGISIDPIGKNVNKHLVRYIGDVINSDLGRVMRVADYVMKKYAIGTDKPGIPGFRSVDDITGQSGLTPVGASRRFWFIPEDMKFTQSDNMLLFNSGRMTLKTEYIFQNKPTKAAPSDLIFSKFFTDHYDEIAEKVPIYKELFEYAKLVSLAQYLKQNGIPLFWFLMANKDLVLTEDSPGVVDELAKGSKYFKGIEIRGGVNMDPMKGQYVYDKQAITAINKAISAMPALSSTSMVSNKQNIKRVTNTFSFDLKDKSYTVVPQHSLTSGKDRRGIRYQTDIAFRDGEQPGLELVRYFNPRQKTMGEFGGGWHLLIPYRLFPADSEKVEFQNVLFPKRMAFTNLISGEKEVLEFSKTRYSIVGWAPDSLEESQVVGLFLMSDVSYRLADKIGNEFWFDQAGYLTDMLLGKEHHYKIEYGNEEINDPRYDTYSFEMYGDEYQKFLNAYVPEKIKFINSESGATEFFTFNKDRYDFAGYIPDNESQSEFKIAALMSDGSLQLSDKSENTINFDSSWKYEGVTANVIKSYSLGDITVEFDYIMQEGHPIISSAQVTNKKVNKTLLAINYNYDSEGRLCSVDKGNRRGE